jgi:hypothetical protein
MSEPTNKPEEGIVVGGKKNRKGLNVDMRSVGRRLLQLLFILVVLAILAAAGYIGYRYYHHKTTVANLTKTVKPGPTYVRAESVIDKYLAQKAKDPSGAYTAAKDTLSQLEIQATSTKDKEGYALALVQLYDLTNRPQEAMKKATQAEKDYHSASTAARLAAEYQLANDKANAVKYYQLAVERSPKTSPTVRSAYNDYRIEIQTLEAQK